MTTRDPRSRPQRPGPSREAAREPTQSLDIDLPDDDGHPSLAMGTSGDAGENRTKIESPAGRNKTPVPKSTKPPPVPARGADDPDHRIGSVLGAYKIVELLGKGGMGYVFRAEHVKLGREVALKQLRGDYAKRRDAVLRFFQEAKTVNRVRHRNIVDVTDFVELDDGTTFIIMELLRGQSLGKWARTGIDLPRALAVLVQICDGLGAAHAVGVVHRDLKPDNVIVVPTTDGAELVKLLDFGVAKLVNRDDEDIGFQTAAGSVIGTPAYMSPEQAGGMLVDHRSDIYSLGAIMYELFCGQPMFRGRSFGEYVRKHLTEMPTPPRQTQNGATIDPALEALIMKCLAKDPNQRFNHILELRDGLLQQLGGMETHPPSYAGSSILTGPPVPPSPSQILPPHLLQMGAPAPVAAQLPTMVPQLPAAQMVTTVPTPPSQQLAHLTGTHPSLAYSHYTNVPLQQPTPWWVWFVGGALAVGLGIAGALWYVNRGNEPTAAPIAQPTPGTTTTPPGESEAGGSRRAGIDETKLKFVELRFDSLPSAGVYAAGRSAELCRTPCNFNVDLADGGPTDRRTFVVRAEGYRDMSVAVDFSLPKREFSVTLDRLEPTVPTEATSEVPLAPEQPVEQTAETPVESAKVIDKPSGKKSGGKKSGGKKGEGKTASKVEETKPEEKVEAKPEVKPEVKPAPPVEPKPAETKKPVGNIDPSDTIDPFRRKK